MSSSIPLWNRGERSHILWMKNIISSSTNCMVDFMGLVGGAVCGGCARRGWAELATVDACVCLCVCGAVCAYLKSCAPARCRAAVCLCQPRGCRSLSQSPPATATHSFEPRNSTVNMPSAEPACTLLCDSLPWRGDAMPTMKIWLISLVRFSREE